MSDPSSTETVTTNPAHTPETAALVKAGAVEVEQGKITLADLMQRVVATPATTQPVSKKPPVTPSLSPAVLSAIGRLPEVFNKVVVTSDRKLTAPEAKALVEESQTISTVITALEKRKKESLRETLANHADHMLSAEEQEGCRTDDRGHYAPWETQNISVEGTGLKIQRFASGGKPRLDIEDVEALHAAGKIDRATYLQITKKPDLPRVLDEAGLAQAVKKNPALFFLLADTAHPTSPTTTVKVVKDS